MDKNHVKLHLRELSLSLFRKDFFGIYHGSISAKVDTDKFLINIKEAVFDTLDEKSLIELYFTRDYRWNDASIDASIHHGIYKTFSDAKFVAFTMPPFTTAYSLHHDVIFPKDFFGKQVLDNIQVYNPKNFDDWYDRAASEIPYYLSSNKTNIMIIRGYGVYSFNRDLHQMAKQLAILEKSCRMLMLDSAFATMDLDF